METRGADALSLGLMGKFAKYVTKNFGYLSDDPAFLCMKTLARFEFVRELTARTRTQPDELPTSVVSRQVTSPHALADVMATLKHEGYYVGLELLPEVVTELQRATQVNPCFADRKADQPFKIEDKETMEGRLGRRMRVAGYFDQQEDWPVFMSLRTDPLLLAIAKAYLGRTPAYMRSEIFWSFPAQTSRAEQLQTAQVFHCDINDFRTIKFFFHLSDVGAASGPHVYIKKGPRRRTLFHQLLGQRITSLSEAHLLSTYRRNDIVPIHGKAGLGFAGDPFYFHKGDTPKDGPRLLMQLEFGCRRYRTWYRY